MTNITADPNNRLWLAYLDDEETTGVVIGMLSMVACPKIGGGQYAIIENLVVTPPLRQQGIGTKLVEAAKISALTRDIRPISLTLVPDNAVERQFCQKLGFIKVGYHTYRYPF